MLLSLFHIFVFFVCIFVAQVGLELTVAHAGLQLVVLLSYHPQCGIYRCEPPGPVEYVLNLLALGLTVITPGVTHLHL